MIDLSTTSTTDKLNSVVVALLLPWSCLGLYNLSNYHSVWDFESVAEFCRSAVAQFAVESWLVAEIGENEWFGC